MIPVQNSSSEALGHNEGEDWTYAQEAIQARLNKPPKKPKKLGNHGNLRLALVQAALRGVPNKVNRDLKEAYLMAANLAGWQGRVDWLSQEAG